MPDFVISILMLLAILLLAILLLALLLLLWPVRVDIALGMESQPRLTGWLRIRFLSGLFSLRYSIALNLTQPACFLVLTRKGAEPTVLLRLGEKKQPGRFGFPIRQVWKHMKLRKLKLHGALGIPQDACATALLTGLLATAVQSLFIALTYYKGQEALDIRITPDFNNPCFRLNLEGIALCMPIHIISAILIYGSKNRKGKTTAWHILSKTS